MALLTECRQNVGGSGYKHCTPSGVQLGHANLPDQNDDPTLRRGYPAQTINTQPGVRSWAFQNWALLSA